jgi:CDP-glucose 4,6-dehydratase
MFTNYISQRSKWQNSTVFVTGATGLLGSHLTKYLVDRGANVIALVRDGIPRSLFFSKQAEWNLGERVTVIRGQLEDFSLIERVLSEYEVDTVFHLAAQTIVGVSNQSPLATFKANIEGTWNILEACRLNQKKIKRVIIASSDKAYGDLMGESYDENFPLRGEHPYDVSKSCADLISRSYFVSYGLPVVVTRCGNFFGAGDLNYNRLVPGTIRSLTQGERPVIRSDGKYIRDYLYVEDGVEAYLTLAEELATNSALAGEAFNFSYGLRLNVMDMVKKISAQMGKEELEPEILGQAHNEIPVQCLNSDKAKKMLSWGPRFGFDEGMKRTISWYVQETQK